MKCEKIVKVEDRLNLLLEDIAAILTEHEFVSRWAIIEGYHLVGKRILEEKELMPLPKLIEAVAKALGKSRRTLYYATQFAEKYPDLNKLPEGKAVSWHKIVNLYLPEAKQKGEELVKQLGEHEHQWEIHCRICGKRKEN